MQPTVELDIHRLFGFYLQTQETLSFLVSIKDIVGETDDDSENDNLVKVPISVIVLDENDETPKFQNVSIYKFSKNGTLIV